jgi:hypothetical protein
VLRYTHCERPYAEMDTSRNAANPGASWQCPSDRRHDGGGRSVSSDSEPRRNLLMYDHGIVSDFIPVVLLCARAYMGTKE